MRRGRSLRAGLDVSRSWPTEIAGQVFVAAGSLPVKCSRVAMGKGGQCLAYPAAPMRK